MKYQYLNEPIPQEARQELNDKILYLVDQDLAEQSGISREDIYNAYTPTTPISQKSATVLFSRRPMSESNAARIPGYSVIILGSVAIVSLSLLTS